MDEKKLLEIIERAARRKGQTKLNLSGKGLTSLPPELGKLTSLTVLTVGGNKLTSLPPELGKLTNLKELYLSGNPLESPPPAVVEQGTQAILAYLREQLKQKRPQWLSKLLLVGEGGVGKSSLLRALRGEEFIDGLDTTHGIGVEQLELAHPSEANVTTQLNTWDFGGQQIYHATHQFFFDESVAFRFGMGRPARLGGRKTI